MTAPDLISRDADRVKAHLTHLFDQMLTELLSEAAAGRLSAREAEDETWKLVMSTGAQVLTAVLAWRCRAATDRWLGDMGLTWQQVHPRLDADYTAKVTTTFGPLRFPWFALRDADGRTHAPARSLFPHHPQMRCSEKLLEWECVLGADHPFRKAADALLFFTHQAADVEDTTVERHAVLIGQAVPVQWQYRTPTAIRDLLRDHATLDKTTGQPILYASTDAHALRRFTDETWTPRWKMTNGIRLWCVDRVTDQVHHIGGEYTWGDCLDVRNRFERLRKSGHLPSDGDYGEGVVAQIALLTDGVEWIEMYVLPLFPRAVLSLDPYHVVEQVAEAARAAYPGSKRKSQGVVKAAKRALGMRTRRKRSKCRKGRKRRRRRKRKSVSNGDGRKLLSTVLRPLLATAHRGKKTVQKVVRYVEGNLYRLEYGTLRARGFSIGSGAMESLHRTASQVRLKRSGCHWTREASQAILNLRMLALSGRWNEYWVQARLPHLDHLHTP